MFIEEMQKNSVMENTKGGLYYPTTFNSNLDLYCKAARYSKDEVLNDLFNNAYNENNIICAANILYNLDIREGKGERRVFKVLFNNLTNKDHSLALKVLKLIPVYGRYDYLFEALDTPLEGEMLQIIKTQLSADMESEHPSLLGKWMPSLRCHNTNSKLGYTICFKLGYKPKEYRHILKSLRDKIKIVEHNLTNKDYDGIEYAHVPSKAMRKYRGAFIKNDEAKYGEYLASVKKGTKKINANLFPYEIIKGCMNSNAKDKEGIETFNLMWENQKDVLNGDVTNALVIADTSGSMWSYNSLPISSALSLAIYLAERNMGAFHNMFINFSDNPSLQMLNGETLSDKLESINYANWASSTNIDKAMELILNATLKAETEAPSHLVIISDMEFDRSVKGKTNLSHWQSEYQAHNLKMPKIVFWCVGGVVNGVPTSKNENDVCIISGHSPNVFKNILSMENYNPEEEMLLSLKPYIDLIEKD